jgi:hypothetical protein
MLKSPEVIIHGDQNSNLRLYFQHALDVADYNVGENVLLGNVGLNTLCNSISLSYLPVVSHEPMIKATLTIYESWNEMDDFIGEMKTQGIRVTTEPHAYDKGIQLTVWGVDNIYAVGSALRDRFTWSKLEVDELYRPVVHPELIGSLLDDLANFIAERTPAKNPFHNAYHHDWAA